MFPGMPYYLIEKSLSAGDKFGKGFMVKSAVCLVFPFL